MATARTETAASRRMRRAHRARQGAGRKHRLPEPSAEPGHEEQRRHQNEDRDRRDAPAQRAQRRRQERLDDAPAVEAGTRDEIEDQRRHLQQRQKCQRRIQHRCRLGHLGHRGEQRHQCREHDRRPERPSRRHQRSIDRPAQIMQVDVDGAAGQPDAAQRHDDERKQDAVLQVGVAQRIERQVALVANRPITAMIRDDGVPEFVQAERDHEPDEDEREHQRPRVIRPVEHPDRAKQKGRDQREESRTDGPALR